MRKAAKNLIAKQTGKSPAVGSVAAAATGKWGSMIDELRLLTAMGGGMAKGATHPAMMIEQLKRKLTTNDKSRVHAHITTIFELYAIFSEEGDGFDIRLKEYRRMVDECDIIDKESGCDWKALAKIFEYANAEAEATQVLVNDPDVPGQAHP